MKNNDKNILLVEDDINFGAILTDFLKLHSYNVTLAKNGIEGLEKFKKNSFGLCILDVMLPFKDGFTLAKEIRDLNKDVPLFFLTAKTLKDDVLKGYKLGADDYLNKPFNLEELLLRVTKLIQKAIPNNSASETLATFEFAGHKINFESLEVILADGASIQLTKTEALLLRLLIENKNTVVSREKILQTVWGYQVFPNTRTIDNFITAFRKYFEKDSKNPEFFISIRGVGYKFKI